MNKFIFLSILFASGLFVILRFFSKKGIDNFHGIVVNYFVASAFSFFNSPFENWIYLTSIKEFLPASFLIGFLFIVVFLFTAKVTQTAGIGIASVSSKLSLVIPVIAGVILYNESMQFQKIIGLLLALLSVLIINKNTNQQKGNVAGSFLLPLGLFLGCGTVDTAIKFAQHYYMTDQNRQLLIMCMFASAGILGLIKIIFDWIKFRRRISIKSIWGGILLGVCNYYSLYFLIRSFEFEGAESSSVFAMVNLGVVLLSAFWAVVVFKEKFNKFKIAGMVISLFAIYTLYRL